MRHAARGILFVLTSLLLVWPFGCQQSESDEESEPDRQVPVEVGLRLTEEAKTSIGIVTAPVQSQVRCVKNQHDRLAGHQTGT